MLLPPMGRLTVTSEVFTLSEFDPEFTIINEPDDYYGRPDDTATFIMEMAASINIYRR